VVNDQLFLCEELQRAVTFHIDSVSKFAINRQKHRDDRATPLVVGRSIDVLANRKLRRRKLLLELSTDSRPSR
jgi:hypothetical protein